MTELYDITIIGGGPAGLFTAFYAGMRKAKTKIIESLSVLGGQPQLLYPEKNIYDIAAFPSITGQELTSNLLKQIKVFDPAICLDEEVLTYKTTDQGHFSITTNKGRHLTKTIIIAAGAGAFQHRKLNIEGAEQYEGECLQYIVGPMENYKDKEVVINGGGDSAVDWALALNRYAKKVTLCHRRDKFRALDYSVEQLLTSDVNVVTPYEPLELHGDGEILDAITFQKRRGEEKIKLEADTFIVNYGFQTSLGQLESWPLEMNRDGIMVNEKMETNIPGIYAVGDVASHDGKVKLIATGFGEAPVAVSHAVHYIHPEERIQPQQSTAINFDE
ncbi:MAG: NAD(P)/FAD-dependent oxidoreductase [Atopococcus tabaci]|uniref:Ferredoxin--NADP reductase n=1 Tax=Atopococcus tabaci TaxID=269774 RepID=A0AA43UBW3_9LACT|nr:NAD(P)/FAD-dependent oxidoreductase [Atopococcus tabaci]